MLILASNDGGSAERLQTAVAVMPTKCPSWSRVVNTVTAPARDCIPKRNVSSSMRPLAENVMLQPER